MEPVAGAASLYADFASEMSDCDTDDLDVAIGSSKAAAHINKAAKALQSRSADATGRFASDSQTKTQSNKNNGNLLKKSRLHKQLQNKQKQRKAEIDAMNKANGVTRDDLEVLKMCNAVATQQCDNVRHMIGRRGKCDFLRGARRGRRARNRKRREQLCARRTATANEKVSADPTKIQLPFRVVRMKEAWPMKGAQAEFDLLVEENKALQYEIRWYQHEQVRTRRQRRHLRRLAIDSFKKGFSMGMDRVVNGL